MSRLSRWVAAVVAASVVMSAATAGVSEAAAAAKVRQGPAGVKFYDSPIRPVPGKRHGDAIWQRALKGAAVVPGAARTTLVLYRSTDAAGDAVPVTGVVSVPRGTAPKGGWPVITYAHGTTGIADACAPSRDGGGGPVHPYNAYVFPLLTSWLKAGYAVVRTDYQGLGTPFDHQYLVGGTEGRSVLDMARAARQVEPRLSKATIIAGHSQGGHAALFAAALAPRYAPELRVRGTVAFAPASHLDEQLPLTRSIATPNAGLTALVATIAAGLHAAYEDQADLASFLTPDAVTLALKAYTECLPQLGADATAAGLAPSGLLRADADLPRLTKLLDRNDPSHLKIRTPVLLEQGLADSTVIPLFTDQLASELRRNATEDRLFYRRFDGVDHAGVVIKGGPAATAWIRDRLR